MNALGSANRWQGAADSFMRESTSESSAPTSANISIESIEVEKEPESFEEFKKTWSGLTWSQKALLIRFSQNTIADDWKVIHRSMKTEGFRRGLPPLRVVYMPDGRLTSFDNRRLYAIRLLAKENFVWKKDPPQFQLIFHDVEATDEQSRHFSRKNSFYLKGQSNQSTPSCHRSSVDQGLSASRDRSTGFESSATSAVRTFTTPDSSFQMAAPSSNVSFFSSNINPDASFQIPLTPSHVKPEGHMASVDPDASFQMGASSHSVHPDGSFQERYLLDEEITLNWGEIIQMRVNQFATVENPLQGLTTPIIVKCDRKSV